MKIADWHRMGYNGFWDGHWDTPETAIEQLHLDPESKRAQAIRRGMEIAISEEREAGLAPDSNSAGRSAL